MRAMWRQGEITDLQDPDQKTAEWKRLNEEFKKLVEDHRKVIVKNEFDRIYTANGGSRMNAYTSYDHTAYFISVPANKLELFMWMESERLLQPVFREFYAERDVVFEERRMRTESTPGEIFRASIRSSGNRIRTAGRSSGGLRISRRFPKNRPTPFMRPITCRRI